MIILIDSIPTTDANGLPPKVEPWVPGVITSIIELLARTAEIGSIPPDNALPKIKISGLISSWSQATIFPVLPIPVWTSSAIIKTLYSVHSFLTSFKYPTSGIWIPASPWIGSSINETIFGSSSKLFCNESKQL